MNMKTHVIGGAAAAVIFKSFTHAPVVVWHGELLFIGAALFGSLLPDLCHPGSFIGRKTMLLSKGISKTFGHRTVTHSWLMLLFLYWAAPYWPYGAANMVQEGLLVGAISHIALDAMTSRGVQFFYPIPIRVRFPLFIKTGSIAEKQFGTFVLLAASITLIHRYIVLL
ncbi:metal-dependent hydrolase [Fictibacillus iocasae]|uniref:Metal-dependent hydrolase n=1 Tax=Fictibacillus iocasae TaxID=2715437 RepID=A0ABW2NMS8_9BACL